VALVGAKIIVPAGTVTPLENVNGRNAIRLRDNWEEAKSESASRAWGIEEGVKQTDGGIIKPLGLSEKAVYLVHLVYSSFRPAFFSDHGVDLFAKGFDIFGIGKETVQNLCGTLLACND